MRGGQTADSAGVLVAEAAAGLDGPRRREDPGTGYASLKDVAGRAGVSFQTASKVLNGGGSGAPATLERIRRAAEEVGYVPNALARGLVTKGTKTLGIITADPSDHVLGRFVVGAEAEARQRGWVPMLINVDHAGSDVGRYVELLSERRVDGILMAAPQAEGDPVLGERLCGRLPVVSLHRIEGVRVPLVGSDHVETGLLAVRHLLLHGHRLIGVVTGLAARQVTNSRLAGHRRALTEADVAADPELVEEGDWTVAGGYLSTMRLLQRAPGVSALFVHNDYMAMGALRALYERGLRVPDDVAVVGCDDAPLAAYAVPSLTTVRVPFEETGRVAIAQLLRLIAGEAVMESGPTLLPVELVARASCGCASVRPQRACAPSSASPETASTGGGGS